MRIADMLLSKGYSVGQQLGEGTYSKVRTAENLADGRMCAVKIVDRHKARTDYLQKFMPRELAIIAKLNHSNIVKCCAIIENSDYIFQVMDYAEKGDVMSVIQEEGRLPEDVCKRIFQDTLSGMKYLHDMNIAHRDLKCENILIFHNNRAAISDFGFSCFYNNSADKCQTFCGSKAYASPEVLQGIPYDPKLSDVWSLGIVLFTMLCGTQPFGDGNVTTMVQKQLWRTYTFPMTTSGTISSKVRQLVHVILEPCVNMRPTVATILVSDWLKK